MWLSIVLPAHNEAATVDVVAAELLHLFDSCDMELVIIDDGSTDATGFLADRLAATDPRVTVVHRRDPPGLGRAVRRGLAQARGDVILLLDSDGECRVHDAPRLVEALQQGYDVAVASRFIEGGAVIGYSGFKRALNRLFNQVLRLVLRTPVRDLTFGFKVLSRRVATSIPWTSQTHGIAAETTLLPIALGARVKEVPTTWVKRKKGHSSFQPAFYLEYLRVGWRAFQLTWRNEYGLLFGSRCVTDS